MKIKKVLVTGGAGFNGSNLLWRLLEEGNSATALDNFMSGYHSNLDPFPAVGTIEAM